MKTAPAQWTAVALLAASAVTAIVLGILWDTSIKPEPMLPEYGQKPSYALEGMSRLLHTAKLTDPNVDPSYTVHIPNADAKRFRWKFIETAPSLGWYARYQYARWDLQLTVPEKDLGAVEAMTQAPRQWLLDAMEKPPVSRVHDGPLVNVWINIDGYHGRPLWPFIPIGMGIAGLVAVLLFSLTLLIGPPRTTSQAND